MKNRLFPLNPSARSLPAAVAATVATATRAASSAVIETKAMPATTTPIPMTSATSTEAAAAIPVAIMTATATRATASTPVVMTATASEASDEKPESYRPARPRHGIRFNLCLSTWHELPSRGNLFNETKEWLDSGSSVEAEVKEMYGDNFHTQNSQKLFDIWHQFKSTPEQLCTQLKEWNGKAVTFMHSSKTPKTFNVMISGPLNMHENECDSPISMRSQSLLHHAISEGLDVVLAICNAGIPLDVRNVKGETPLLCAAFQGKIDIVKALWMRAKEDKNKSNPHILLTVEDTNVLDFLLQSILTLESTPKAHVTDQQISLKNNQKNIIYFFLNQGFSFSAKSHHKKILKQLKNLDHRDPFYQVIHADLFKQKEKESPLRRLFAYFEKNKLRDGDEKDQDFDERKKDFKKLERWIIRGMPLDTIPSCGIKRLEGEYFPLRCQLVREGICRPEELLDEYKRALDQKKSETTDAAVVASFELFSIHPVRPVAAIPAVPVESKVAATTDDAIASTHKEAATAVDAIASTHLAPSGITKGTEIELRPLTSSPVATATAITSSEARAATSTTFRH